MGKMQKMKRRLLFVNALLILVLMIVIAVKIKSDKNEKQNPNEAATQNSTTTKMEELETEAVTEGVSETAEEEIKEPVVETVTITATGDCTFAPTQNHGYEGSVHEYYDNYGADYFMKNVKSIFEADDFTVINLECVLSNSTDRVEKEFNLKGKPEYTSIMTGSSIEGCTMGNNHTRDYGEAGLVETKQVVSEAGICYALNDETAVYTTAEGKKIGVVSVALLSSNGPEYQEFLRKGIEKLREQGMDVVIAACHWGVEKSYYPTDFQQTMAHNCIDWGADLVIGTHPHVLQGVEVYNGKVICYSLGNFCFGGNSNPSDKNTMLYQQTFTFIDGAMQTDIDAKIIPCRLSGHDGYNDYQPVIAEGEQKNVILQKVNEYSKGYSEISFDEDGKLTFNNLTTGETDHE